MNRTEGLTIWLTGLSGAGKTTTGEALAAEMNRRGYSAACVDGDALRQRQAGRLGFGKDDRFRNVQAAIEASRELNERGVHAVVSLISPYREMRAWARRELDGFVEVYVRCPLEVCERRDVKGLYAKARRGEIERFTGISDPYEEPEKPELVIDTDTSGLEENVKRIWTYASTRL